MQSLSRGARFWAALAVLFFVASSAAANQPAQKQIAYDRLATLAERIAAGKKFDRLDARIRVRVPDGQKKVEDLIFTIPGPNGDIVIRPSTDGTLVIPLDPALKSRNPMVTVNVPADVRLQISLDLKIKTPDPKTIAYADIAAALAQLDDAIGEQAGLLSFAAPSAKGVRIFCGADCTASLNTTPVKTLKAEAKASDGSLGIEMLHDDYKRVPNLVITLSAPATAVRPVVR